jgi:hypothetical protein
MPAGEEVQFVPGGLTMAEKNETAGHGTIVGEVGGTLWGRQSQQQSRILIT